jgi:hypothetical protein
MSHVVLQVSLTMVGVIRSGDVVPAALEERRNAVYPLFAF